MARRSRWMCLMLSVPARVRLDYWISFWRFDTSARVRGSSPRALQRSTWNVEVLRVRWGSRSTGRRHATWGEQGE
jgi:hypothetical protein